MQLEATVPERVSESGHELAAEQPAEHADRQEEAGPARPPRASVFAQTTSRDHAVDVGMMDERLAPGMEDGEEPELSTEMFRVQGDLLKRTGRGTEQEIVDDRWVLKCERRQQVRDREDHVCIGHRQYVGLACFEPGRLGAALTLRTVTVPARVVGDPPMSAGVARIDVAPQPRAPAGQDPVDDRALLPAPRQTAVLEPTSQVPLEDLRDLVSRSLAHLLVVTSSGLKASNGLATERSRSVATCV